ncbi:hypothetical protein DL766_002235 [Monosporascus sp. MC13-8B]|uniref:Cytochrome P450 n=1 Tax=Monosporascus cannonballus TaxID=155416 RepID=A0ABY0HJ36_9PEZI|nr:hypothetical protein DL763_004141 [Monosporascus cannonballus]RYO94610.1 hypothetical protein DL762_000502 [Monosporascus cannonballus]RYP35965.1 hypothetical protein DL766_002235 [Monosporascus sp. MC13-8B]
MAPGSSVDMAATSWEGRGAAFLCGIALHLAVFRRGEWDLQAAKIVASTILVYAALTVSVLVCGFPYNHVTPSSLRAASSAAGALLLSALAGLYGSMLVYRVAFHRLRRFPGPFAARFSNFYQASLYWRNYRLDAEVRKLHRVYGDILRIGPNELSINDPKALHAIHSTSSGCTKGPWYTLLHPCMSLNTIRNHEYHAQRRKAWDHAFTLRGYQPRVAYYTDLLLEQIQSRAGQPVNVTDWFAFYAFDVMGSLSYSESYGMLQRGKKHPFMTTLRGSMKAIGLFSHLDWLFPIAKATPILNREDKAFWRYLKDQTEKRIKVKPETPDVFSFVLDDYNARPNRTRQDTLNLYGDAYLITVAGSDTTSAALTFLMFELCTHPDVLRKLRDEVDSFYRERGTLTDYDDLHKLKYLQACINEAMRLHPAVPRGLQRITPPEGLQVGDCFIPGNAIVQIPTHTMFADERCFPRPEEFIPERWTTRRDELVRDASVFVPFSMGVYSCVGKQLALMEVRYVASQIVRRFEFGLAAGSQTADAFRAGITEVFTVVPAPLEIVFKVRS